MELEVIKPPTTRTRQEDSRAKTILTISDSSQIGLWVVRSLGRAGLTVCNLCSSRDDLAGYSRYVDGAWLFNIPASSEEYAEGILHYARKLHVGSVMTIAERSHKALLRVRDRLEPEVHLFSPPRESFEKAVDKGYLHRLCQGLGIPVARGTTLDVLMETKDEVPLKFPLVLRTRDQVGRRDARAPWKVAYAQSPDELRRLHDSYREISSNLLVQEYHPGAEEHVHVLVHDDEPFMVCAYIGEHHMPLAGGVTVRRITCNHPGPINDAIKLLKELKWNGVATVQFHYDPETDRYIFLEINPRFCAGLATVIRAGFDSPLLQWQSFFAPEAMTQQSVRLGLRSRILGGDVNWMLGMVRGDPLPPNQKRLSPVRAFLSFIRGSSPWTKDDIFMLRDPKPFLVDTWQMLKRRIKKS